MCIHCEHTFGRGRKETQKEKNKDKIEGNVVKENTVPGESLDSKEHNWSFSHHVEVQLIVAVPKSFKKLTGGMENCRKEYTRTEKDEGVKERVWVKRTGERESLRRWRRRERLK